MQDRKEMAFYKKTWERWCGDPHGSHFGQEVAT